MNVEIGAEAALFPVKEYINGIAVAVYISSWCPSRKKFNRETIFYVIILSSASCHSQKSQLSFIFLPSTVPSISTLIYLYKLWRSCDVSCISKNSTFRIRIGSGFKWVSLWTLVMAGKNNPQKRKKVKKCNIWNSGCPLFFCSLEVHHGSLRINISTFLIDKIIFFSNDCFSNLVIINLDLDPDPNLPKAWFEFGFS